MLTHRSNALLAAATLVVAGLASSASAANVTVTKANGDFVNGGGIPANNFTISSGSGVEVALKARGFNALSGQPISYNGVNRYVVSAGYAAGRDPLSTPASTRAWWTFDYQFTPAPGSVPADYVIRLEQDFDPAYGATNYTTHQSSPAGVAGGGALGNLDADGFKVNPGPGTWSSDTTPFVHSQSWNYEFGFYPATYDPNVWGEYQINLTAFAAGDLSTPLASTSIFVAVPEPTTIAAAGLIGLATLRRRRASL